MPHCSQISNISCKTLAALCLMLIALPFLNACKQEQQASAPAVEDKRPIMRIAFVGNEYILDNNMIYMIQLMAQNDPSSNFQIKVDALSLTDATLAQLWRESQQRDQILTPDSWDYVVIQPHSMWASSDSAVYVSQKNIAVWAQFANSINAVPVLFRTWPLERGNSTYGEIKHMTTLKNHKNMFRLIHGYSNVISKKRNLLIAPVGDYWMQTMEIVPNLYLYELNKSSPTLEGSYLTALVIYKTLVDSSLNDITYIPEGMDEETKDLLISIASKKIAK